MFHPVRLCRSARTLSWPVKMNTVIFLKYSSPPPGRSAPSHCCSFAIALVTEAEEGQQPLIGLRMRTAPTELRGCGVVFCSPKILWCHFAVFTEGPPQKFVVTSRNGCCLFCENSSRPLWSRVNTPHSVNRGDSTLLEGTSVLSLALLGPL